MIFVAWPAIIAITVVAGAAGVAFQSAAVRVDDVVHHGGEVIKHVRAQSDGGKERDVASTMPAVAPQRMQPRSFGQQQRMTQPTEMPQMPTGEVTPVKMPKMRHMTPAHCRLTMVDGKG